jgi:hypothetical protein
MMFCARCGGAPADAPCDDGKPHDWTPAERGRIEAVDLPRPSEARIVELLEVCCFHLEAQREATRELVDVLGRVAALLEEQGRRETRR